MRLDPFALAQSGNDPLQPALRHGKTSLTQRGPEIANPYLVPPAFEPVQSPDDPHDLVRLSWCFVDGVVELA